MAIIEVRYWVWHWMMGWLCLAHCSSLSQRGLVGFSCGLWAGLSIFFTPQLIKYFFMAWLWPIRKLTLL